MRTFRRLSQAAALVAALVLVTSGCGSRSDSNDAGGTSPGITDTEITFGGTIPYSGPASSYAVVGESAKAYFAFVNEELGGVEMGDGKTRKINYLTEDDAYDPSRTVEAVRKLVEQQNVFGMHNMLGTGTNLSVRDYLNRSKVPQVYIGGGGSNWGDEVDKYPWTMGWQLAYSTESSVWAQYLRKNSPNVDVAILYQNDDLGKDLLKGFEMGIEGSDITIVRSETYNSTDATVDAQMTNLAASGADVFLNMSAPKFAAQALRKKAELGWNAEQFIASVSSSIATVYAPAGLEHATGLLSAEFLKDPSNPLFANDPDVVAYKERLAKYGSGLDPNDRNVVFAWAAADTLYETLSRTKEPTRESFMDSARNLDIDKLDLVLDGIPIKTGPNDGFPIESAQIVRFTGESNEPVGGILSYEGATPLATE